MGMMVPGIKLIAALCGFVLLLSGGQMLFKQAALSLPAIDAVGALVALARNPWIWAAGTIYGAAVVLWVAILQKLPLSIAYPFVALSFVVVPLAAALFFQESLTVRTLLGAVLILAGIYVSTMR